LFCFPDSPLTDQAMSRSYGVDDEIDMSELDDELAAIDEQLSLEAEVVHRCAVSLLLVCASTAPRWLQQRLVGCSIMREAS
jgi:hypothetical protein